MIILEITSRESSKLASLICNGIKQNTVLRSSNPFDFQIRWGCLHGLSSVPQYFNVPPGFWTAINRDARFLPFRKKKMLNTLATHSSLNPDLIGTLIALTCLPPCLSPCLLNETGVGGWTKCTHFVLRFTLKHGMEVKQMSDCAVKLYYYLIMPQKHKRERQGNLMWRVVLLLRLWVIPRDTLHLVVSHPVPDGTPLTSARPWKSDLMEQHRATFWVIPFHKPFAFCVCGGVWVCACACELVCVVPICCSTTGSM